MQVAAGELQVEMPRVERGRRNHVLLVEAGFADVEVGHGGGGAGPAELKAALVEAKVARDGAAVRVGFELQRPGDPGGDVVAVEEQGLAGVERQVEQGLAAREGDRAVAGDAAAARRLAGDLAEDQLRTREARLA